MSTEQSKSTDAPQLELTARRYNFQLQRALKGNWNGGDQFKTILANALSIPLPSGERLFIRSVKHYLDEISDSSLRHDVTVFFKQEALHTKEHVIYNNLICDYRGYDLAMLEAPYKSHNEYISEHADPLLLLATTVCMEHLTAIVSHLVITDSKWVGDADESVRNFWLWHSLEEIEHKAVAFDVYMNVCGDKALLDEVMRSTVKQLCKNLSYTVCQMYMMEGGRPGNIRNWLHKAPLLHATDGLIQRMTVYVNEFYLPDFHPWQHDNSELISVVAAQLESAFS